MIQTLSISVLIKILHDCVWDSMILWYSNDYSCPQSDNDELEGDKTTICDCRAFRYDGHETFTCDGGGEHRIKEVKQNE